MIAIAPSTVTRSETLLKLVALAGLLLGALLRCHRAYILVLNPDEALHLLPCFTDSAAETLRILQADSHPPLYAIMSCALGPLLYSEFGARLLGVVAGLLVSVVLYFWLRKRVGLTAACVALLLVALSPRLIELSAEVRSYSVATLFTAYALYSLDRAIGTLSSSRFVIAGTSLVLAIFTDYSLVLVCPAIALYGFARLWESQAPRCCWLLWTGGQLLALGVFFVLYWFHARYLPMSPSGLGQSWLRDGFHLPGQPLLAFVWKALTSQFAFVGGSTSAGLLIAVLVLLALRKASMAWRILVLTPFATGLVLSLLRLFPFGPSHHSSIVSVVIAVGLGLAAQTCLVSRRRIRPLAVPLVVLGCFVPVQQFNPRVAAPYRARQEIREGSTYIAGLAAGGQPILASGEAKFVADAYQAIQRRPRIPIEAGADWNIPRERIEQVFAGFRRRHSIPPDHPVIFVEGGFLPYKFPEPKPSRPPRRFGTIRVWEIYEYGNARLAASPPSPPRL